MQSETKKENKNGMSQNQNVVSQEGDAINEVHPLEYVLKINRSIFLYIKKLCCTYYLSY